MVPREWPIQDLPTRVALLEKTLDGEQMGCNQAVRLGLPQQGSGLMVDGFSRLEKANNYHRRQDLELRSLLRVWLYHWRAIASTTIGVILVTLMIVSCQERQYTAVSLVKLNNVKSYILKAGKNLSKDQQFNPIIANSVVSISSNDFLKKVADRARLFLDPEFSNSDDVAASTAESIVLETLADRMTAGQRGGSHVIAIQMTSRNPTNAAHVANIAARLFIDQENERLKKSQEKALAWLMKKIRTARADLVALEGQAIEIAWKHGLEYTGHERVVDHITDIRHIELTRQLAMTKAEGGELKARYQQAFSSEDSLTGTVGLLSSGDPALQALRNLEVVLETRLSEFKGDLGDRHPAVINLKNEIASTQEQIVSEETRGIHQIKNELIVNEARQAEITATISNLERISDERQLAIVELNKIMISLKSQKTYLSRIVSHYHFIQNQGVSGRGFANILSLATTPTTSSYPDIPKLLVYAIFLGFFFGLIGVFFFERWVSDFGFKSLQQLRGAGLQPFGIIPELSEAEAMDSKLEDYILTHPHSAQAEAFQRIRSRLCEWRPRGSGEATVVLVTSSSPSEGKTAMAVALARQMMMANSRVLLIDTNIGNPSVANILDLEPKTGLCEILCLKALKDVKVYRDPRTKLDVIPPGKSDSSIGNLLRSSQMNNLINELRRHYDWIFLDSAAFGVVADSLILARHADMIVYVAQWLKATRDEVCMNVGQLVEIGGSCVGVALTRVDMDACNKYIDLEEVRHYGYYNNSPSVQANCAPT